MSAHGQRSRSLLNKRDGTTRGYACRRKVAYSKQEAHAAAKRRSAATGHRIVAYECPFCPRWHIGHPRHTKKAAP